ncbi:MAG: methanesulfonate monooxygenase [Lautropia sp.]
MSVIETTSVEAVVDLVYESCLALDNSAWGAFLALCDPERFRYRIKNFCPEIRKEQTWMDQTHEQLRHLFELLPKHNSDSPKLTRHATVYRKRSDGEDAFTLTSHLTVYRTEWDGGDSHLQSGITSLYVVGRYVDTVRVTEDGPRLTSRVVDLDTRQVGIGLHYIL